MKAPAAGRGAAAGAAHRSQIPVSPHAGDADFSALDGRGCGTLDTV